MPFGIYSANASDFAELARNGFTTVGPWYVPAPDRALLDAAAAAGLGVVFPVGDPRGREQGAFAQTAAATEARIGASVREVVDHPAIVAWYVLPEEVRAWEADELSYVLAATAAVRTADPQRRPVLSYQPNHYDAARLAPVVAHFDIATKGMYANFSGYRDKRAWVPWSVDELETAGDSPVWVVPEMFEDPPDAGAAIIATWARHDVYAGLVAGARGVLLYSGYRRPNFNRYDDYLTAYKAIARELNGPLALGDVLLSGKACRGDSVEIVAGPTEVEFEASGGMHRLPSLGHLELVHAGARWTWLVNSSAEALTLRATSWTHAAVVSRSADVQHAGTDVHLPPWGVAVLRRP